MNEINYDPSPRDVRIFGLLWLLFFGALGGVVIWRVITWLPRQLLHALLTETEVCRFFHRKECECWREYL